ncbi:hypothetical protein STEG23_021332 [Scotinomys teguina]
MGRPAGGCVVYPKTQRSITSEDGASPVSQEGRRGVGSVENSEQEGNRRTGLSPGPCPQLSTTGLHSNPDQWIFNIPSESGSTCSFREGNGLCVYEMDMATSANSSEQLDSLWFGHAYISQQPLEDSPCTGWPWLWPVPEFLCLFQTLPVTVRLPVDTRICSANGNIYQIPDEFFA